MKNDASARSLIDPPVSRAQLRELIARQPRVEFATWPTPLEPLPNLSKYLQGPRIYLKREDLTGLGLGGNKTRVLEFRMADALAQDCDCVVAGLDVQSNSARQLTAAANRLGLQVYLVLQGTQPTAIQGNLLVNSILGAHVEFLSDPTDAALRDSLKEVTGSLRARNRRPYVMNTHPGFELASALASAMCAIECREQLETLDGTIDYIFASSRGKGQSGLVLASTALQDGVRVVGIAAGRGSQAPERTARIVSRVAETLGLRLHCSEEEIVNEEDYAGEGYGIPSGPAMEAILLMARTEGVLLDPVYTGKALAGLIDHVRSGRVPKEATVVFVHTGGTPALFANSEQLSQYAGGFRT